MTWPFKRRDTPDDLIDRLIVPPRYECRLTGESFQTYDEGLQDAARRRLQAAREMRVRASKVERGESVAPLREAKRA